MLQKMAPFQYVTSVLDGQIERDKEVNRTGIGEQVDIKLKKEVHVRAHKLIIWDENYSRIVIDRLVNENRKRNCVKEVLMLKLSYFIQTTFKIFDFELDNENAIKTNDIMKKGLSEALVNSKEIKNLDVLQELNKLMKN